MIAPIHTRPTRAHEPAGARPRRVAIVCALLLSAAVLISPSLARAKSNATLKWPLGLVYKISVRFVRVDRDCEIVDKDGESAYVMFSCTTKTPSGEPIKKRGSLELSTTEPGRVRAQVVLSDEPRYVELRFLELLERKIRDEAGAPIRRRKPNKRPAPGTAGDAPIGGATP